MKRIIALITDFGESFYVGQVKGVIKSINPNVEIIDITHNVPKFNIKAGQFILYSSYKYFLKGTIFLVVVDPGVGSSRKAIVVKSEGYYFIGPDNGLFGFLKNYSAYEISVSETASPTFHARDVFAPTCAKIALSENLENLKPIEKILEFDFRKVEVYRDYVVGEVIYIDDFGNLITNIEFDEKFKMVEINGIRVYKKVRTYANASKGDIVFLKGSYEFLEISRVEDDLKSFLDAKIGDLVIAYF
ncbi:MAG: SAM-dependent chlorinase/fluorinase [candidate division WOR-3 bacterium]|nr:SAM-dependent chlorinase/fluorinase [candidate division WOR-3 bacterium]MCX7947107.1 SAM-dependent chlorinase/fluorinase [candidate division WOR-3 bacterium]MDW8149852.1 SAM-dependent chlorinase/fluorinase [candidate division WOR-3 bacterium]